MNLSRIHFIAAVALFATAAFSLKAGEPRWITAEDAAAGQENTWIAFSRSFVLDNVPADVNAQIAVDSKYWLWVNGECVVFEGGLKRGPNPQDTYFDVVDIAPYLVKGDNIVSVLVDYFGKQGFSHHDSGMAGLYFNAPEIHLSSDKEWLAKVHPAFGTCGDPKPNYRLPESNIRFDARKQLTNWEKGEVKDFHNAVEISENYWGKLHERPIPQWKDYGIKEATFTVRHGAQRDTVVAVLPYNMQMTPIIELTANDGTVINIDTDHTFHGATWNVRAEYICREGSQSYESLGWMNGQQIWVSYPKGSVDVHSVKYRETGYDTEFSGSFSCDEEFYNLFWKKGLRTLYVNMRDTFFDCPDRERAQWWGDAVVLSGEAFYTLSPSAHALARKAIHELCDWRRADGTIHSPIPAGNYDKELPGQMLASVGLYGFWNYYMNTGDIETLKHCYPVVKEYLKHYTLDETGLTAYRKGDWAWGDWGKEKDMRLIYAGWHHIALQSAARMANALGFESEASEYEAIMRKVAAGYNACWNGTAYRHPDYAGQTDDRVQALAVLAGIAGSDKYPQILETLKTSEHASPYMEKYVTECLFRMGEGEYAMERNRKRFDQMINDTYHTTLFEGWELNSAEFGGGTANHAWSAGTIAVIAKELCGIYPTKPGYETFRIAPTPVRFKQYHISVPTVKGLISSDWDATGKKTIWTVTVPDGTEAEIIVPTTHKVKVNGHRLKSAADSSVVLSGGTYTFKF